MNRKITITLTRHRLELFLLFLYVFMSYVACGIVIPVEYRSYTLYLFVILCGAFYVFDAIKLGYFKNSNYFVWAVILIIVSFITTIYSPVQTYSSGQFYMLVTALIIAYLTSYVIQTENDFDKLCWFFIVSALALSAVIYFSGHTQLSTYERLGNDVYGNANSLATMLMIAQLAAIWLVVYGKCKTFPKVFAVFSIVVEEYMLFLTGGRKFIIIPFLFLYILFLLKKDRYGRHKIIKYSLIIAFLIYVAYFLMMNVDIFYNTVGSRMEVLIRGLRDTTEGTYDYARTVMKASAMEGWLERPIFGWGFDSFKVYSGRGMYSHCNYTELLFDGGIILFIAYYSLYFVLFKRLIKENAIPLRYKAFGIAIGISFIIFDYGAVTYSVTFLQIILATSIKVLSFRDTNT